MRDVPPNSSSKERGLLADQPNMAPQPLHIQLPEINTVELHRTATPICQCERVVETLDERDDGALSGTGGTDEGGGRTGFEA